LPRGLVVFLNLPGGKNCRLFFAFFTPYLRPRRWAVLAMWVPEMPFQMACLQDPGLRDRPLAFLGPGPRRTPCLWLVNRLARTEGAAPGEPLDQALRRLPGLRVLDPAPQT